LKDLTKNDIIIKIRENNVAAHYLDVCEHLHDYEAEQLRDQILKNQANSEMYEWAVKEFGVGLSEAVNNYKHFKEDAEKLEILKKAYDDLIDEHKIVERLKKRIEELTKLKPITTHAHQFALDELQKILGEKNEF